MTAVCVIIEVKFREETEDCLDLRYFRAFMIDDDSPRCFCFPSHTKTTFDLDLISTLLIRTRRISCLISCITCILFPSGCSPCMMQRPGHARHIVQQYLQPLRKDLIGVTISIRTLCLVSTGPSTSSSSHPCHLVFLRASHLAVQHAVCRIVFRRPTARFNPGLCLCIWPFPRRHPPSHMPTFSAASRSVSSGRLYCASASLRSQLPDHTNLKISVMSMTA
jgi:hypothetical protein